MQTIFSKALIDLRGNGSSGVEVLAATSAFELLGTGSANPTIEAIPP
jgi:hypothetical protein